MKGPFFVGEYAGKPMLMDGCGRILDHKATEEILRAGLTLFGWSGGQLEQQHNDVARAVKGRDGR